MPCKCIDPDQADEGGRWGDPGDAGCRAAERAGVPAGTQLLQCMQTGAPVLVTSCRTGGLTSGGQKTTGCAARYMFMTV